MPVFLFSDIEGSTARWEAKPAMMQQAVNRHDELLRSAMNANNGRVFKTVGDAFCVTFDSPEDALRAALEAQRSLLAEDWSAVDGLRVRMALHAGEAEARAGDFFGPPLNRVARILGTAHGGQVVASGTLADAAGNSLPPGISLRALGTFHLKDLERPERIYQLVAPDLPTHFKPLRTLDAIPNNLPTQSTAFIGREEDVVNVRRLLADSTLVTIAGTGGVGKTRIALQCAADAIDRMPDGAWFVNLAPLADAQLVPATILTALEAPAEGDDAVGTLVTYLRNRELLIVLDNCEHVIEAAARVVASIRERCPRVTILTTSRELLHLPGESVYRLPPLDRQDSVRLFVQRARSALPGFAATAENQPAIDRICGHLDGIPLAIELAAARVRAISLEELLRRLSERFRILTGGTRTALPRQQTLRAMIDWSYELLNASEKALFRRIAVFSGSFSLEAAGGVCSDESLDEWTILDLLSSLVDKSLIVADVDRAQQRYHLLESIQDYAKQKLQDTEPPGEERYTVLTAIREYAQNRLHEAGEASSLYQRHALYYARRAQTAYAQFDADPPENWLAELMPDLDNFRAALRWSLDEKRDPGLGAAIAANTAPIFLRLSLLSEGIAWCNSARERTEDLPSDTAARLEYGLSMLYTNQQAHESALPCALRAVELSRKAGDDRALTRALSQAAQLYAGRQGYAQAQPYAEEALQRARQSGDSHLLAHVLRRCAFALPPDQIENARAQFLEALAALDSLRDPQEACLVRQWWAEAEASAGFYRNAIDLSVEALSCADSDTRMYLCSNLALYSFTIGDVEGAIPYAREALRLARDAGHELIAALAMAFCSPEHAKKNPEEAVRLFGYADARTRAMNWARTAADDIAFQHIAQHLESCVPAGAFARLRDEGRRLSESDALRLSS